MVARSAPGQAFELLPALHLMILYMLETASSDEEWDAYLAAMVGPSKGERFRCIVVTDGGFPTRAQQARLIAVMSGKQVRVAVISPAIALRFVVSALLLVNRGIKAYSPKESGAAFSHIGLAPGEWASAKMAIERLRRRLKGSNRLTDLTAPRAASAKAAINK
jgi:hypothetical protein